jgi:hypothetical protein
MFDLELEQAVAKIQKSDTPLSKSDQYAQLKKFSLRQRLPTESPEQAFTRLITTDPYGKALYKTYTQTKGASFSPQPDETRAKSDGGETEGMKTLKAIADQIRSKYPDLQLSKSAAISLAMTTDAGRAAYEADRKSRLRVA